MRRVATVLVAETHFLGDEGVDGFSPAAHLIRPNASPSNVDRIS